MTNKSDFIAQGQRSARMGNCRSPGNEYAMPVFGTGTSWQARAFAAGFREECARLQRSVTPPAVSALRSMLQGDNE